MKIAIFYHTLFMHGSPPVLQKGAVDIVNEQVRHVEQSGLLDACEEFTVGINGGRNCWMSGVNDVSDEVSASVLPRKARRVFHGLGSKAENLTLVEIEKWVPTHPDWYVLYMHVKGATHDPNSQYGQFSARWRRCMMNRCVGQWTTAVGKLGQGYEAAGCHWMTGMGHDKSQHFFAGNFWWATSNFLATLPSIFERERIKMSGIASAESRYEAEVWIGNGNRRPNIVDLEPDHGLGQCP